MQHRLSRRAFLSASLIAFAGALAAPARGGESARNGNANGNSGARGGGDANAGGAHGTRAAASETAKERQASESRVAVQTDRKALSEQLKTVAPKDRAAAIRAWEQSNAGTVEEAARLKREALLERTRAVRAASRGGQR